MSSWRLFGKPYFLYSNSAGRQRMDTSLVLWLIVMSFASDSEKMEAVHLWALFWRTVFRNVFDVSSRNLDKSWRNGRCTLARDQHHNSSLVFSRRCCASNLFSGVVHFSNLLKKLACVVAGSSLIVMIFVVLRVRNVTSSKDKTMFPAENGCLVSSRKGF